MRISKHLRTLCLIVGIVVCIPLAGCGTDTQIETNTNESSSEASNSEEETSKSSSNTYVAPDPVLAVLDINARVGDEESTQLNVYSANYMAEIAGVPYTTTTSLDEALKSQIILLSSPLKKSDAFSDAEYALLKEWVTAGGILVSSAFESNSTAGFDLFGVQARTTAKSHTSVSWLVDKGFSELSYLDESEEQTSVIGKSSSLYYATTYTPADDAEAFGCYEDQSVAAVKHTIGQGATYLFGSRWRDVIARFHMNKDGEIHRTYNNGFEPSGDIYALILRSIYIGSSSVTVWKYTVPGGFRAVLVPTHDCDSSTAYEAMGYMSDYENELGVKGHYFLTVHYYRDAGYVSAFYNENNIKLAKQLVVANHTVGSHSISHFPDFNNTDRFPLTEVTEEWYGANATHDVDNNVTTNGSTWAEVVLSKQILERDLGNKVRSFRSGHLCVNKNLPEAYVTGGYQFTSTHTAGDLLSEFPSFHRMQNDWSGALTNVLNIPLHISDVFSGDNSISDDHWDHVPAIWFNALQKLKGNFASSVLLIHPNREYKMTIEKMLVEMLDRSEVGLYNFEDYGDFWLTRFETNFSYWYLPEDSSVIICASKASLQANHGLSFMVECSSPVSNFSVIDESNNVYVCQVRSYTTPNSKVAYLVYTE